MPEQAIPVDTTQAEPQQLKVQWTRNGSRLTGALVISAGGESLVVDDGNLVKQSFQERAIQALFAEAETRGIDLSQFTTAAREPVTQGSMRAWLMEYAAKAATEQADPHGANVSTRLAAGGIVRGGHFITKEVAGIATPYLVLDGSKPTVKWELALQWRNGLRQVIEFTSMLQLTNGGVLHLYPEPMGGDPLTCRSQWGRPSLERWVGGDTPDAADVFARILAAIYKTLWFDDTRRNGMATTLALFVLLTYVYVMFRAVGYIHTNGPRGSGKTELLSLLGELSFRPIKSSNTSGPVMFRSLNASGGTFILDEAERQKLNRHGERSNDLMDILLSGYKDGSPATRCEGEANEVRSYNVYGPKVLASIGQLPDPLPGRCIRFGMLRKPVDIVLPGCPAQELSALRDDIHALMLGNCFALADAAEGLRVPAGIANRDLELWRPLLALAAWLERCGVSGVVERVESFAEGSIDEAADQTVSETDEAILYALLHRIGAGQSDCIAKDLLDDLKHDDDDTWKNWKPAGVAAVLRTYGIRSKRARGRNRYRFVTPKRLRGVMAAYGVLSQDQPPQGAQSAPSAPNGPGAIETDDSAVHIPGALGADPVAGTDTPAQAQNPAAATKNRDAVPVVPFVPPHEGVSEDVSLPSDDDGREEVEL